MKQSTEPPIKNHRRVPTTSEDLRWVLANPKIRLLIHAAAESTLSRQAIIEDIRQRSGLDLPWEDFLRFFLTNPSYIDNFDAVLLGGRAILLRFYDRIVGNTFFAILASPKTTKDDVVSAYSAIHNFYTDGGKKAKPRVRRSPKLYDQRGIYKSAMQGKSSEEIAHEEGISDFTVPTKLYKLRKKMP